MFTVILYNIFIKYKILSPEDEYSSYLPSYQKSEDFIKEIRKFQKIPEKLRTDGKSSAGHPKAEFRNCARKLQ